VYKKNSKSVRIAYMGSLFSSCLTNPKYFHQNSKKPLENSLKYIRNILTISLKILFLRNGYCITRISVTYLQLARSVFIYFLHQNKMDRVNSVVFNKCNWKQT